MAILLLNVGYNLLEFKDNIKYYEIKSDLLTGDSLIAYDNILVDKEFERDKAILNIIFSLFVFILLRYGPEDTTIKSS